MRARLLYLNIFCLFFLDGCTHNALSPSLSFHYDKRQLVVQVASLFNQRSKNSTGASWQGDWHFRRGRLAKIDKDFRMAKLDLIFLTEVMEQRFSPHESDVKILGAGALSGYSWKQIGIHHYLDTHEDELLALASSIPSKSATSNHKQLSLFQFGSKNYMGLFLVNLKGQDIAAVNILTSGSDWLQFLPFIEDKITQYMVALGVCSQRLIIAGKFVGSSSQDQRYNQFLERMNLVDTSTVACGSHETCYTESGDNPIYQSTHRVGPLSRSRSIRLLVHRNTIIYQSRANIIANPKQTQKTESNRSGHTSSYYPLHRWGVESYGWISSIRLRQCP